MRPIKNSDLVLVSAETYIKAHSPSFARQMALNDIRHAKITRGLEAVVIGLSFAILITTAVAVWL